MDTVNQNPATPPAQNSGAAASPNPKKSHKRIARPLSIGSTVLASQLGALASGISKHIHDARHPNINEQAVLNDYDQLEGSYATYRGSLHGIQTCKEQLGLAEKEAKESLDLLREELIVDFAAGADAYLGPLGLPTIGRPKKINKQQTHTTNQAPAAPTA